LRRDGRRNSRFARAVAALVDSEGAGFSRTKTCGRSRHSGGISLRCVSAERLSQEGAVRVTRSGLP
jgi:hypothetical protein